MRGYDYAGIKRQKLWFGLALKHTKTVSEQDANIRFGYCVLFMEGLRSRADVSNVGTAIRS